jgi:hypothetical protein
MTSGIYKLTFKSGRFYIGKSIDIPVRWRQHYDKLRKGMGTVRMQIEFNRYHDYNQEVLLECHSDHIDIMETYFINCGNKELMLNTTFPTPLCRAEYEPILANPELLKYSTSEHIAALANQVSTIKELQAELDRCHKKPPVIIKNYGDSTTFIQELQAEIDELEIENEYLISRLEIVKGNVKKTNWFSRIFN